VFYYLFDFLHRKFSLVGSGVFQYISFRAVMAAIVSLLIAMVFGKRLIRILRNKQIGESVRDLGLEGQLQKSGTPTMGGIIIIGAILIPTLLFAKLENVYIILMLGVTLWLGIIGFLDDYIKVFKKNKKGLSGKFKIIGQVGIGIIVGTVLFFNKEVVIREPLNKTAVVISDSQASVSANAYKEIKSLRTTVPFFKNNELDYSKVFSFANEKYVWIFYVLVVIIIITAVSNGANITDGLDGLAAGISAIIGITLGVFAYVSGNTIFSTYLNIMYIPYAGELVIFCAAFVGACVGFLWYNSFPAQVFMGDTGSLSLGGIIAVLALILRKELLIPVLCGVFLAENLSVIIQVYYFKYTRKRYGEGRRIFKMSPLHHHYQKLAYHESKIVTRFWIVGILLAIFTIATLKLR